LTADHIARAHAQARTRAAAEQIDPRTLLSIAGWLRVLAKHYPARRARKLEAAARFVEAHNERVSDRAFRQRWASREIKTGS
jgi:hypothetical protein